ncbi:lysozyme [Vibrio campbellii]|uniref:lysozyme n=1 Tax=Vibrio campbellii TaxID=680 RepID=UPI001F2BA3BC|nr:lysozyme [Vibrio campbellii]MCE7729615.1 lysozyme [Vibrio campbellii]
MNLKSKAAVCSITAVLAIVFNIDDELRVSENGLRHIANEEGCRTKAYRICSDSWIDRWTIGFGHTQGVLPGQIASNQQIARFFVNDVASAERDVKRLLKKKPSQAEYDMMVSFVFHMGAANLSRSTLLKKFNQGKRKEACLQYPRWVYVQNQDCRIPESNCSGIVDRRNIEMNVCLNGWKS